VKFDCEKLSWVDIKQSIDSIHDILGIHQDTWGLLLMLINTLQLINGYRMIHILLSSLWVIGSFGQIMGTHIVTVYRYFCGYINYYDYN